MKDSILTRIVQFFQFMQCLLINFSFKELYKILELKKLAARQKILKQVTNDI